MSKKSILMIVRKYPADFGHTTVINNLCNELGKKGVKVGIGAFEFTSSPPENIKEVQLNKFKLFFSGMNSLDFDVIIFHQSFPSFFLLTKKSRKSVLLYYHGASNTIQRIVFKISMMFYKNQFSKILSVSQAGINQMKKMIGEISADVIYNGVNTTFFNPELPQTFKKGEPQLLFVSGLRPYKKASFLIESMTNLLKIYPNAHLQIVGTGEELSFLKNMVKELNLTKNVELTGKIPDDELKLRYSSCDLYVSASTFEVCPVPTLEAMACGKPLVLFDIEPHQEIIRISQAGKIFSHENHLDFIKILEDVYQNKESFSISALKFAKEHDWKLISEQLLTHIDNLD